jgi:hypothetical protein
MTRSADSIRDFVLGLDLPEVRVSRSATRGPRPKFTQEREVVAVGAQLTDFI